MGSLNEALSSAKQKHVRKIARILLGSFEKGDRVKVVRMPKGTTHWIPEWVGLEGTYIGTAPRMPGVSKVYFPSQSMCDANMGWLVEDTQLEYL
jgi:hypothetical protein